jgi:iron complex transport system ATP-binding protein
MPDDNNLGENKLPLIEYKNVTLMRKDRKALDCLTLSIRLGEHVAILGPNGSGKSTLIKTITRELYPLAGVEESYFRILGRDRWDIFELRAFLGIVDAGLIEAVNYYMEVGVRSVAVKEFVLAGFFSSVGLWPNMEVTNEMKAKLWETLELLEILHLLNRNLTEISTGEQRRVLIARALVHDPKALLLDEPSSSLDMRAASELRKILRKIAANGVSIILVTHDLTDIIPEIKRVILLKEGHIFKDGTKEEILTSETISGLFGAQFEVVRRDGYYYLW